MATWLTKFLKRPLHSGKKGKEKETEVVDMVLRCHVNIIFKGTTISCNRPLSICIKIQLEREV